MRCIFVLANITVLCKMCSEEQMTVSDGETKLKLVKVAREEFIEKGYANAS